MNDTVVTLYVNRCIVKVRKECADIGLKLLPHSFVALTFWCTHIPTSSVGTSFMLQAII